MPAKAGNDSLHPRPLRALQPVGSAGSTCCCARQEMLVVYSPTCPSSRSAASTYWTRAGLSVYPGIAMRGCGGPGGEVIAMLCKASVVPEHPSPRETYSRRESNEESPESRRLFGAVWGAAAVRLPHFAPADSPRKTPQSHYDHAKTRPHRAADSVLRPPRPFRPPSGSP